MREATKENLEALLTAADGDVTTLLNLAAAAQANPSPSTLLLATALHRIHQFVETSWDDTFAANAASTSAHLTQWEHLGSLFTRVATLEQRAAHPGTANMSPAQPHTQDALAARCDALEAQVASLRRELEMATRSSSTDEAGDDRQRLYARIKHVNDMRREAEMMRSEMLAQQRSDRVATLAVDVKTLQGRVDVSEHDMERTDARAGLHRQFEIAYLEGEITKEQVSFLFIFFFMGGGEGVVRC